MMREFVRDRIRPVGLTVLAPVAGFVLLLALEVITGTEVSRLLSSLFNLLIVGLIATIVFPRLLGIPFGRVSTGEFLRRVGLYAPGGAWRHVVLGLVLAACTLSGMLVASILTGKYTVDASTITLPHLVFSLNPAVWEELFYRGVLMVLLLRFTRSLKWAVAIQVVLFGAGHIKGVDAEAWVDVLSVMIIAVGFTYVAYKTRSLLAGVVFHYVHDALLLFVQLPNGMRSGVAEDVIFYGLLWLMVGVGCGLTKLAADKMGVRAAEEPYSLEKTRPSTGASSESVAADDGFPASAGV
jgi:membrane protease YdiL (CAAX protease family)